MRVEISTDRTPTTEQQLKLQEVADILIQSGMEVEIVGHRPGDRKQ